LGLKGSDFGFVPIFESEITDIHMVFTKFYPILNSSQGWVLERAKMKKRIAVSLMICAALFTSSTSAIADAQSDYQLAIAQYKVAVENWNATNMADRDGFRVSIKAWEDAKISADRARRVIADNFKNEAEAIKARTSVALLSAANAKEKKAIGAAGKVEMESAIASRNAALAAVVIAGPKPVKPVPAPSPTPPVKPAKAPKNPPKQKLPKA
jgi:hypothetical protein